MTINDLINAGRGWVADYGTQVVLCVGAVAVLLGAALLWRWWRTGHAYQRTGTVAVILATGFAAEGMWEVARESVGLDIYVAVVLFAMFEVVMVNQALLAKYKIKDRPGAARRHMTFVWLVAAASGAIASLNSANVAEFVLRLLAPAVAAGIWWTSLTADGIIRNPDPITWRLTPRRVLVFLRIAEPGDRDVVKVDRDRQVRKMAALSYRIYRGAGKHGEKVERALELLLLTAEPDVIAEARVKAGQAALGRRLTVPSASGAPAADLPGASLRDLPTHPKSPPMSLPIIPLVPPAPVTVTADPDTDTDIGVREMSAPVTAEPDTRPDTDVREMSTDVTASADTGPVTNGRRVSGRVATPTVKLKPFGRTEVAAQIAKMVARNPNISAGQVASRLDISDRTARRYLSDLRPADVRDRADTDDDPDPHHRINGNHPDLATTH